MTETKKRTTATTAGATDTAATSSTTPSTTTTTTTTTTKSIDRPLCIGDRCAVMFLGLGELKHCLQARILERRLADRRKRKKGSSSSSSSRKNNKNKKNKKRNRAEALSSSSGGDSGTGGDENGAEGNNNDDDGDDDDDDDVENQPPQDLDTFQADELEYYVHFEGQDRRLDKWVTLDLFVLDTLERVHVEQHQQQKPTTVATAGSNNSKAGGGNGAVAVTNQNSKSDRSYRRSGSTGSTATASDDNNNDSATATSLLTGGNWRGTSGDPSLQELEHEHDETTKVKNIEKIYMGGNELECWYYSPYPDEYQPAEILYVCEYCLKYCRKARTFRQHKADCKHRTPPGKEIYRELGLSVYEIDGQKEEVYCQNLCLLSKLFLDHKTLYYDVVPFYFYIICQVDDYGAHIVGYFSKEKVSQMDYNLACILTLPQYQNAGYGKFIISLSYELSKREQKTGSPEKPLSDLGKISYRSYWTYVLLHLFADHDPSKDISIKEISIKTGIKTEDILSTLQYLDMIKSWKGQHVIYVSSKKIEEYMKKGKSPRLCKPECLSWSPPSMEGAN